MRENSGRVKSLAEMMADEPATVRFNLDMDPDLRHQIKLVAIRRKTTIRELVTSWIEKGLKEEGQ